MKSLVITPEIENRIKAVAGEDVDTSILVVFEATLADTRPLHKRGTLFDKGRIAQSTLQEMADSVTNGGVPLQTLHNMDELPTGKVFHARVVNQPDGEAELRGQFYLPRSEEALLAKLEAGVIDEVSVGVRSKSMHCSECGWDYLGEDAGFINLFDRVCANEHHIGKDGVHIRMVGMDRWYETSLVPRGAVPNAKIAGRAKALLSADELERIAASGIPAEATILFASPNEGSTKMDMDALFARLDERANETAQTKVELTTAKARVDELEASLTAVTQERDELKATVEADDTASKLTEAEGKVAQLSEDLEAVKTFLKDEAKKALVAAGTPDKEVPDSIAEIRTLISETRLSLHSLLPEGGVAQAPVDDAQKVVQSARLSGFKTARK